MNFQEKMNEYIKFTENNLKVFNAESKDELIQKNLIEAMNYSLEAGGKRIRPVLVYAFCEMFGGDYKKAAAPAAAIEMIHTFSLIHDDLPAMDNDDLRRGKPSCHKAFGEAAAILAGDALSVLPFGIIAEDSQLSPIQKLDIISVLADSVGKEGMIGGQIIDMILESSDSVTESDLRNMYRRKTGALIAASCKMGGICAEASEAQLASAEKYAYLLGLAFQIIDDILDVTGSAEVIGKPAGSDKEENKTTFVTLYGVEKAKKIASEITDEAIGILENLENSEFLIELTEKLLKRNK